MRSAGLKNITAKHLALASQSLSIMISLIPYIRECLRRHLRAKQAIILVDFDKLKRDYQEHQYEIHAKLVAIMGDRLTVHCKTLQGIDWEKPMSSQPNAYMETLVKETGTLHKVLQKYLPGSALEMVMMQVLSAINSRLADEYGRLAITSDAARDRILEDAKYMKIKFAELKGLERPTPGAVNAEHFISRARLIGWQELEDLVRMKKIEARTAPVLPAKTFTTPSLTRPRKSVSSHTRTPSMSSSAKPETNQEKANIQPATPEKDVIELASEAQVPILQITVLPTEKDEEGSEEAQTSSQILPVNGNGGSTSAQPRFEVDAAPDRDIAPETIPLPTSPETLTEAEFLEVHGNSRPLDTIPILDSVHESPQHAVSGLHIEQASLPIQNAEAVEVASIDKIGSPPQPDSPLTERQHLSEASKSPPIASHASETRAYTSSPPATANVKNRLASLFAKRPSTGSLPKIGIPSISSFTAEHLPFMSPKRLSGSPIQPSLDVPKISSVSDNGHVLPSSSIGSTDDSEIRPDPKSAAEPKVTQQELLAANVALEAEAELEIVRSTAVEPLSASEEPIVPPNQDASDAETAL